MCVVHMVCLMVTYLTYRSIYTKPYHNEIQSTSCHGKELWLPCFENLKKQVNEVFPVLIRACCLENISTTPWLCALLLLVVSILLLLDFDAITFCNIGGGTKQAAPEGTVIGACLAYSGNVTIVKCLDTKKAIFGRTFCIQLPKIVTVATWLPCMWQKKQEFSQFLGPMIDQKKTKTDDRTLHLST